MATQNTVPAKAAAKAHQTIACVRAHAHAGVGVLRAGSL